MSTKLVHIKNNNNIVNFNLVCIKNNGEISIKNDFVFMKNCVIENLVIESWCGILCYTTNKLKLSRKTRTKIVRNILRSKKSLFSKR